MLHREGTKTIFISLLILALPYILLTQLEAPHWAVTAYLVAGLVLLGLVLQFFRNPTRRTVAELGDVIAPADGTVVVIEDVEEPEYFKGKRKQISIFMSPLNVHVNRAPVSGRTVFTRFQGQAQANKHFYVAPERARQSRPGKRSHRLYPVPQGQVLGGLAPQVKYRERAQHLGF